MENQYSYKLIKSLPGSVLRGLLVSNPQSDIKLTRDLVITASSRHKVMGDLTYQSFIKQILPMWVLTPHSLTPDQRELVAYGLAFREHFLDEEARLHLPARRHFQMQEPAVLTSLRRLLLDVIELRKEKYESDEQLTAVIKKTVFDMGDQKKAALHWLRMVIGQEQGLPASRLLIALPLDYLTMIEYMLEVHLYLHNITPIDEEQPDGKQTTILMQPLAERRRATLDEITASDAAHDIGGSI